MKNILDFLKSKWYYIAALVVLIVIVVVIRRRRNQKDEILSGQTQSNNSAKTTVPTGLQDCTFPLQPYTIAGGYSADKGSKGKQIATLQAIYNANSTNGSYVTVDGAYGAKTLGAFKGFFYDMIASNGTISQAQYEQIVNKYQKA